jgi:hypothetical protein
LGSRVAVACSSACVIRAADAAEAVAAEAVLAEGLAAAPAAPAMLAGRLRLDRRLLPTAAHSEVKSAQFPPAMATATAKAAATIALARAAAANGTFTP